MALSVPACCRNSLAALPESAILLEAAEARATAAFIGRVIDNVISVASIFDDSRCET